MKTDVIAQYRLAGLDERERGFNRLVDIGKLENGYRASLRYETTTVVTEASPTQAAALSRLVRTLQDKGYRQLRSQLCFNGGTYLGSQEPWADHQDPNQFLAQLRGLFSRLLCRLLPFHK
ncbi:MAG: hypothetical protein FJ246_01650 [Nitrospira sp.]|nr:hypothetical protein [Nitrospira sp.]